MSNPEYEPDFREELRPQWAYQCPDCFIIHLLPADDHGKEHACDCEEALVSIDLRAKALDDLAEGLERHNIE